MHFAAAMTLATGSVLSLTTLMPVHADTVAVKRPVGYLYTTTNGEGINEVVRLARYDDGTVGDEKTYLTYVRGGRQPQRTRLG